MDDWKKGLIYLGGSEEREAQIIKQLSDVVAKQVREIAQLTGEKVRRPQHAKTLAGTANAEFSVSEQLSEDLRIGFLAPGATFPALLRFSNAGALIVSDRENDLRGLAVKVFVREGASHDFLATNAELHHAKDAFEAMWTSYYLYKPGVAGKVLGIVKLFYKLGLSSGMRIVKTLSGQIKRSIVSLATETFWSRSPYRFGSIVARFRIRAELPPEQIESDTESLGKELSVRSKQGDIRYVLEIQRYQDEAKTPLEDSTVAWNSSFEQLGHFVIRKNSELLDFGSIEKAEFNPWNISCDDFEPLGNMNRARRMVYRTSQRARAN